MNRGADSSSPGKMELPWQEYFMAPSLWLNRRISNVRIILWLAELFYGGRKKEKTEFPFHSYIIYLRSIRWLLDQSLLVSLSRSMEGTILAGFMSK